MNRRAPTLRWAMTVAAPLLAPLFLATSATAQTVHKCTVEGKVTYTGQPCQAGSASVIAVPPAPSPDPDAARDLQRMKKEARVLEKQRRQRDAELDRELDKSNKALAAHKQHCDALLADKKSADNNARGAPLQRMERTKFLAQQAAEKLAKDCPR